MKKTWISVLLGAVLIAAVGFGIQQTFASPTGQPMSIDEASKIVTDKYPGNVTEVELEKERGKLVYEIDLKGPQGEYDVKLDAVTGEILKVKQEKVLQGNEQSNSNQQNENQGSNTNDREAATGGEQQQTPESTQAQQNSTTMISMDEAVAIALERVPGTLKEAELDRDDGRLVYEIEIKTETGEADIDVDAYTGEIVYFSIESDLD
ncbi:PepSY domain-containing protein [Bacillus horti]|uniref:Membrane protein YkoI n=1 Tax=Caldalkalibacillus horti TaxID=77523 RepID=A0ABT9W3S2_9BACI|nr:PepSY domain-containing protein [Bacillus horti]MDQ0167901.1 putative membrane protein YkoI [Bacillus horti]